MDGRTRRRTVLIPFARAPLLVAGGALICAMAGATTAPADAVAGKVAYDVHGRQGRAYAVAVNLDGSNQRRLLPTARHGWQDFGWSPDGTRFAAGRTRSAIGIGADAIAVATDGGGTRFVTRATRGT